MFFLYFYRKILIRNLNFFYLSFGYKSFYKLALSKRINKNQKNPQTFLLGVKRVNQTMKL
jgi:hypothetical protein